MKINKTNNFFFLKTIIAKNFKKKKNKDYKKHKNKLELLPGNGAKIWCAVAGTQK